MNVMATITAAASSCFKKDVVKIGMDSNLAEALINTGSSESFLSIDMI